MATRARSLGGAGASNTSALAFGGGASTSNDSSSTEEWNQPRDSGNTTFTDA